MGRRKRKRKGEVAPIDLVSLRAENHANVISKQSCWQHKSSVRARKKNISEQDVEKIKSFQSTSKCFLGRFPSRKRSKRRAESKPSTYKQKEKLSSSEFECYLENLWRGFPEDKKASFTYLDCLWFNLYMQAPFKEKVLGWIKKKQIFTKKYVFVPVVCWRHWSLLIFCHFGEDLESKNKTPCILLLDSLEKAEPKKLEPSIRGFVLDIYKAAGRPENRELISRIPLLVPKVPQQRNGEECGSFVLYYIYLFVESAPENFNIFEGYPYFMKKDWFSPEGLEDFFERLNVNHVVNNIQ